MRALEEEGTFLKQVLQTHKEENIEQSKANVRICKNPGTWVPSHYSQLSVFHPDLFGLGATL